MKSVLLGALALAAIVAMPGSAYAAMYAYVNQAGEVMTTDAATPTAAMTNAPNIDEHSGVMLVGSDDDGLVGDDVPGV